MRILMLVLPWAALGIALAIVAAGAATGRNVFKKQAVAWLTTIVMVVVSIGIGYAKAPYNLTHEPKPMPGSTSEAPVQAVTPYVWDNANVLSNQTIQKLGERNQRLDQNYGVVIGVLTCNYGREDLGDYALKQAGDMGLGGYDFIVALDISGDNYWLIQGDKLTRDFTDQMCSDYAYDYMEDYFARGMYDDAVLDLTEALEDWYGDYYD